MKYTIRENQGYYSLWRYNKPAVRSLPNNVELEFWMRIQELEEASRKLIEAIEASDQREGCGDRTAEENAALNELKKCLES